MAAVNKSICS